VLDVLRNAKILEIVVAQLTTTGLLGAEHWIGETSVVEWWWKDVILEGKSVAPRGHFLIEFAKQLAAKVRTEFSSGSFPNELSTINGLIEGGILAETEGRIRFAHDLYSDWVRARALLEMGPMSQHSCLLASSSRNGITPSACLALTFSKLHPRTTPGAN